MTNYIAKAVHFDGDVLVSGGAFASDSPYGILSVWSKGIEGITFIDKPDSGNFAVVCGPTNGTSSLAGTFYDDANENYWNHETVAFSNSSQWQNTLLSWDMNHVANSRIVQVYISDIAIENAADTVDVGVAFSVDLTGGQTFVFRDAITFYGGAVCDAADFYFDSSFLDLSIEANRRKFISATGKPVYLGANGEIPTGLSPQIFFSGDHTDFLTNKGTGPTFTYSGTLTDAVSSPSGVQFPGESPFRIRFSIANTDTAESGDTTFKIYASKNGGAYSAITTSSTNGVKSIDAGSDADNTIVRIPRLTAGV